MTRSVTRKSLLSLGVVLLLITGLACGDDDDNGLDGTPGAVTDDVQEQFESLQDEFENASDETQDLLSGLWSQVEETYEDWQNATEDERDETAGQFEDLANQLRTQLEQLTD